MPPYQAGSPLYRWANAKGIPPYAVAKKIGREGTKPQPFVEPAFTEAVSKADTILNREVKKAMRKLN